MYCIQDHSAGGDIGDCDSSDGAVTFKIKPCTNIGTCMDTNPPKISTRGLRNHKQRCYKKEEIDFINDLKKRNDALLSEQKRLQGKLKLASLTVQRLKEQVQTWKRRCNASINEQYSSSSARGADATTRAHGCAVNTTSNSTRKNNRRNRSTSSSNNSQCGCKTRVVSNCTIYHNNAETTSRSGSNLEKYYLQQEQKEIEKDISLPHGKYKETPHKQEGEILKILKEQNNSFHDQVSRTTPKWNNSDFEVCSISDGSKKGVIRDDDSRVLMLIERLKEAKSDMNTLHAQYIALESACEVQLQLHQQTLGELEECKLYIEELKDNIFSLNESYGKVTHESISLDEHKEIMQELLQENKYLEDKLSALWELPFLSGEDGTLSKNSC